MFQSRHFVCSNQDISCVPIRMIRHCHAGRFVIATRTDTDGRGRTDGNFLRPPLPRPGPGGRAPAAAVAAAKIEKKTKKSGPTDNLFFRPTGFFEYQEFVWLHNHSKNKKTKKNSRHHWCARRIMTALEGS